MPVTVTYTCDACGKTLAYDNHVDHSIVVMEKTFFSYHQEKKFLTCANKICIKNVLEMVIKKYC